MNENMCMMIYDGMHEKIIAAISYLPRYNLIITKSGIPKCAKCIADSNKSSIRIWNYANVAELRDSVRFNGAEGGSALALPGIQDIFLPICTKYELTSIPRC